MWFGGALGAMMTGLVEPSLQFCIKLLVNYWICGIIKNIEYNTVISDVMKIL